MKAYSQFHNFQANNQDSLRNSKAQFSWWQCHSTWPFCSRVYLLNLKTSASVWHKGGWTIGRQKPTSLFLPTLREQSYQNYQAINTRLSQQQQKKAGLGIQEAAIVSEANSRTQRYGESSRASHFRARPAFYCPYLLLISQQVLASPMVHNLVAHMVTPTEGPGPSPQGGSWLTTLWPPFYLVFP